MSLLLSKIKSLFSEKKSHTDSENPLFSRHGKIGISLSGGAALGYAHIGVLQAIEEAGIRLGCITGTSMGAIMGMMYAAGYKPQEIRKIVKDEKMNHLAVLALPGLHHKGGIVSTERIQRILLQYVPHNSFDRLPTRFYCCTSNMNTLKPVYRGHGDQLVQYVMASAAMPAVFAPVSIQNEYYVDGGIHDNLPIQPLIDEQCDIRIASYLTIEKPGKADNPLTMWLHAYSYCTYATSFRHLSHFNHIITVDPGKYWLNDFKYIDELYEIGYHAAKRYFKGLRKTGNPHE